jgi:hypothetical protein
MAGFGTQLNAMSLKKNKLLAVKRTMVNDSFWPIVTIHFVLENNSGEVSVKSEQDHTDNL